MEEVCAHVFVHGRVQGVSFRYYTIQEAQRLGVRGWVRNRMDGSVEALLQGPRDRVELMIKWCHSGSPYARVSEVVVDWEEPSDSLSDFKLRW